MAVSFKVVARKNPKNPGNPPKYYPTVVTMGQTMTIEDIIFEMKEMSSLSEGDIRSVIANFVTAMRRALFNGHSVNIEGFGVFHLTGKSKGETLKEDVTAKHFIALNIRFRPSTKVKPDLNSKKPGEVITFVDVEKAAETEEEEGGETV